MKKQINPNLLALAKQTCNHELEMPDMNKLEKQKVATTDAHDLKDYIWVPSAEIYVAKQRTHLNLNWNQTHEQLNQEGLFMPTIPQFIEFIKYLKSQPNNQKYQQILDDILTIREPWRANWLDAYFEQRNDGMYVLTKNKTYAEKLEPCLTEDKTPGISLEHWLNNSTKQGLPKPKCKKGDLYYWYPRNESVAWFYALSDWANLNCNRNPSSRYSGLGVFACAPKGRAL